MLFILATVVFCQIEKPKAFYVPTRSVREREETVTFLNIAPDCTVEERHKARLYKSRGDIQK